MTFGVKLPPRQAVKPVLSIVAIAVIGLVTTSPLHPLPILIWNLTPSVPVGLYLLQAGQLPKHGEFAVAELPISAARIAQARNYLPKGVRLIKPVAGLPGETVCRFGAVISLNGRLVGMAKSSDAMHRPLPIWQGCRHVAANQIFLMNPQVHDSFDGRYFGATDQKLILGRAQPLLIF